MDQQSEFFHRRGDVADTGTDDARLARRQERRVEAAQLLHARQEEIGGVAAAAAVRADRSLIISVCVI